MTDHSQASFRADINGLRAWAVVAVIFYHFGVPGFSGGFVGVDVFFVISGFLMTGIVVKGLERGRFSILDFYLARGRRIVPALVVLCGALLALGWIVLLPPDYKMLSTHSVYALSFLSNVEFWQEAGYFDVASHEKWLLHTWSLSVEWQFYLILPIILWAVWRFKSGRTAQTSAVVLGLAASFAASVWVTGNNPNVAFYLLHTRAWEMLGGGLVFLLSGRTALTSTQRRWIGLTGLFLIAVAITVFNKDTAWPGWRAVLPVAAAMLVLLANRHSFWTASRVPQWLGDRSYSLYLWHWPVYVALVYVDFMSNPLATAVGLLMAFFLGHLSYEFVEISSRNWLEKQQRVHAVGTLLLMALISILPAMGIWKRQGVTGRFPHRIELVADESKNYNPRRGQCLPNNCIAMPQCVYGKTEKKVVVVGDSHADSLINAIAEAGDISHSGAVEWAYSGCNYVPGLKSNHGVRQMNAGDHNCENFNGWAESRLDTLPANIPIIIINRYAASAMGGNEVRYLFAKPGVYFSKIYDETTTEFLREFSHYIINSACKQAKIRTVYLVRPIPEMGFHVPKTLSRRMIMGMNDDLSISVEAYRQRNAWVWDAQDAARSQCGVRILDPTKYLCRAGRCYGSQDGRPLYVDDDHLSEFGNKLLVPMFAEIFGPQ